MAHALQFLLAVLFGVTSASAAQTGFPFVEAARAGDLLFISGQIGAIPGQKEVATGGVGAETRQTMENIGAILRRNGLGYGDLVKCTMMLTDMAQWGEMNSAYSSFFADGRYPARSTIGAAALAMGAKVEIECIAQFPLRRDAVNVTAPLGPYSQAVRSDGMVYISGIIAYDPRTHRFAAPTIAAQMERVFLNLDDILAGANLSRKDIVKTTLLLRYSTDMPGANTAYAAYFSYDPKPARTTIPGLDWGQPNILVELEVIAAAPATKER
jgi:2-iminobutanoate/2-iminopropanoate deaminase